MRLRTALCAPHLELEETTSPRKIIGLLRLHAVRSDEANLPSGASDAAHRIQNAEVDFEGGGWLQYIEYGHGRPGTRFSFGNKSSIFSGH
jgi:hypothetical protein